VSRFALATAAPGPKVLLGARVPGAGPRSPNSHALPSKSHLGKAEWMVWVTSSNKCEVTGKQLGGDDGD